LTPPCARTVTSTTPLYIAIAIALLTHIAPFLRYLPTETSHLSIAGPHYLCTLVSHIPHSISLRASIKVSKFCPRICKIATLVRAYRILTKKENIKRTKAFKQRERAQAYKQSVIASSYSDIISYLVILDRLASSPKQIPK
jgi:hypothetical protein